MKNLCRQLNIRELPNVFTSDLIPVGYALVITLNIKLSTESLHSVSQYYN